LVVFGIYSRARVRLDRVRLAFVLASVSVAFAVVLAFVPVAFAVVLAFVPVAFVL
jgi:hypothetical protein